MIGICFTLSTYCHVQAKILASLLMYDIVMLNDTVAMKFVVVVDSYSLLFG